MINYMTMILQMNGGTPGVCSQMKVEGTDIGAICWENVPPISRYRQSRSSALFLVPILQCYFVHIDHQFIDNLIIRIHR